MNKKAMIQFKFILSIIVGALILSFFIYFAFQHIKTSEKISAVELVNYLDLKLDILSNSLNSNTQFNFPDKNNINFICDKIFIDYKEGSYSTSTDKIISSPTLLKENNIQIWSKSWLFPFKVTNFYYISNKKINFYIEDSSLIEKIPKIFNVYPLQDTNGIIEKSKNSDKVIVIFSSQPKDLEELLKNNIKVLHILNNNQITFYPESKTISYLNEEMLFLTIFSQNYDNYECIMKKAIDKLEKISSIYKQEALLLKTKAKQECSFIYDQLASNLQNLPSALNQEDIKNLNEELSYNACPKIY